MIYVVCLFHPSDIRNRAAYGLLSSREAFLWTTPTERLKVLRQNDIKSGLHLGQWAVDACEIHQLMVKHP